MDDRKRCYFNDLPELIIIKIFSYLRERDIFQIPNICRSFHRLSDSNYLWREWYCSKWNVQKGATQHIGINWKLVFKEKFIKEKESKLIHDIERDERLHSLSDPNFSKKSRSFLLSLLFPSLPLFFPLPLHHRNHDQNEREREVLIDELKNRE